jgi:hypothetical protein
MTRAEIKQRARDRMVLEAQERHVRIETERIKKLEAEFVAAYIAEIEDFLAVSA